MDSIADLAHAHGSLSPLGKALDLLGQNVTLKKICADGLIGSSQLLKELMCFTDR